MAQADALQVAIGIEAGRGGVAEAREERRGVAAVADVVADRSRLGVVEDDEVAAAGNVSACDAVACVSSCQSLPWMIDVKPSSA